MRRRTVAAAAAAVAVLGAAAVTALAMPSVTTGRPDATGLHQTMHARMHPGSATGGMTPGSMMDGDVGRPGMGGMTPGTMMADPGSGAMMDGGGGMMRTWPR